MNRSAPPGLDLTEVRSIGGIISTAARLYARYPTLFVLLAALILVPYEVLILIIGRSSLVTGSGAALGTESLLALITLVVIVPLVSALELQALVALGEGQHPEVRKVFAQVLPVLLGVAAAQIIAGILIFVGFFLLVIPGIILSVRFAVVAQTAAFEQTDWPTTLRRSWGMSRGNFLHILGVVVAVAIIEYLVSSVVAGIFSGTSNGIQVAVLIAVAVVTQSFGALVLGLLYFDLRARESTAG